MAVTGRSVPWRQGHFLPDEALQAFGFFESADSIAIMISHDCDVVQTVAIEPNAELIVGRSIKTSDGNCTHSKNPRKLNLKCTKGRIRTVIELLATNKRTVPKEGNPGLVSYIPR